MEPIFEGFKDRDEIAREFAGGVVGYLVKREPLDLRHAEIEIAVYDGDGYWGEAFILFRDTRNGKWYEVHGSHCSCFGLEDQWRPEPVEPKAILMRESFVGYNSNIDLNERIRTRVKELFA